MSRQYKFRAWNSEREDMMDWEDLSQYDYLTDSIKNDKRIVMQYTGLLDKNGIEIYEGDIFKEDLFNPETGKEIFSYVVFKDGMFTDNAGDDTLYDLIYNTLIDEGNQIEVIGNIYENKELLKTNE